MKSESSSSHKARFTPHLGAAAPRALRLGTPISQALGQVPVLELPGCGPSTAVSAGTEPCHMTVANGPSQEGS